MSSESEPNKRMYIKRAFRVRTSASTDIDGVELSVNLKLSQFEDKFAYIWKTDLISHLYQLLENYVDKPDKTTKAELASFCIKYWNKIPKEIKTTGLAYRIWIFNVTNTKSALVKLKQMGSFNIKSYSFLSFTSKIPTGSSVFKRFWSVFRSASPMPGNLVLIQKQSYKKGISVTDFYKYLQDNKYLVDEEQIDEDNHELFYDQIDDARVKLANEEQEILVFDNNLNITIKELVGIKVVVAKSSKLEGAVVGAYKFVDVGTIEEATTLIRSLGLHV